jgi:tricarballylate dehydrogenase
LVPGPVGIVVNRDGERFLDEGADFRNYTYARYGAEILRQPRGDRRSAVRRPHAAAAARRGLRGPRRVTRRGRDRRELADALGFDRGGLERTVEAFDAAVTDAPFDPAVKDGKRTVGIDPPKSNWAQPLDEPPFVAFPVTCGITFTFGGVRVDASAQVLDTSGGPMPASTPPASSSAASSSTTTPAAPA